MIFVYIRIYYAAKQIANKGLLKEKYRRNRQLKTTDCDSPDTCKNIETMKKGNSKCVNATETSVSRENHQTLSSEQSVLITKKVQICSNKEYSTKTEVEMSSNDEDTPLRTLSARVDADNRSHTFKDENGIYKRTPRSESPDVTLDSTSPAPSPVKDCSNTASPVGNSRRDLSAPIDTDQMSDMDPSSSDSGAITRCSVMKPLKMRFCHPLMGKKINKPKREMIDMGKVSTPKAMRDPEKEKKRLARKKEKRATLILGLIMGSFIACWLPFFIMYILGPITSFPAIAFDIAFWLGYMNSAFNPVIYTIFNKDFRRAFRKILFK